jgi:hypothetical protein
MARMATITISILLIGYQSWTRLAEPCDTADLDSSERRGLLHESRIGIHTSEIVDF